MTFLQCTECDKKEGECQCERPSFLNMLEPTDHVKSEKSGPKKEQKKVKGRIGQWYVESIIRDGKPIFLCNVDGNLQLAEKIDHDGITYIPLEKREYGYQPYEFTKSQLELLKNNPPTKQELLEKSWNLTNHFIDATEIITTLISIDTI